MYIEKDNCFYKKEIFLILKTVCFNKQYVIIYILSWIPYIDAQSLVRHSSDTIQFGSTGMIEMPPKILELLIMNSKYRALLFVIECNFI